MPKVPQSQLLLPSLLDRLVAEETSSPTSKGQYLRELKESVRRDLQNLLNTRWHCTSWPPDLTELEVSLLSYGLPDLTSLQFGSPESQEEFRRLVERTIRNFEPRLRKVSVEIIKEQGTPERTLRLRIDGLLHVEPTPEPVVYDSVLEPMSGNVEVKGGVR